MNKMILLTVRYDDLTGKFWWDSYIKNKIFTFNTDEETIHDVIKRACEEEGMELTYKGKPQACLYTDKEDGNTIVSGYIYRGKGEIHDRNMTKPVMVYWDVMVEIHEVVEMELEEI